MTKHQGGQGLLAPLAIPYLPSSALGAHRDHQLDFCAERSGHDNAPHLSRHPQGNLARSSSFQDWQRNPISAPVLKRSAFAEQPAPILCVRAAPAPMEPALLDDPTAGYYSEASQVKMEPPVKHEHQTGLTTPWTNDGNNGGKKKNYQRYPKPPYSYLAMIAMVIQNSPEKKLTLSEVRALSCPLLVSVAGQGSIVSGQSKYRYNG